MGGPGILGVDGLKDQQVVLDFAHRAAAGSRPSRKAPDQSVGASVVKARRKFGQLTVVDTDLHGNAGQR